MSTVGRIASMLYLTASAGNGETRTFGEGLPLAACTAIPCRTHGLPRSALRSSRLRLRRVATWRRHIAGGSSERTSLSTGNRDGRGTHHRNSGHLDGAGSHADARDVEQSLAQRRLLRVRRPADQWRLDRHAPPDDLLQQGWDARAGYREDRFRRRLRQPGQRSIDSGFGPDRLLRYARA